MENFNSNKSISDKVITAMHEFEILGLEVPLIRLIIIILVRLAQISTQKTISNILMWKKCKFRHRFEKYIFA